MSAFVFNFGCVPEIRRLVLLGDALTKTSVLLAQKLLGIVGDIYIWIYTHGYPYKDMQALISHVWISKLFLGICFWFLVWVMPGRRIGHARTKNVNFARVWWDPFWELATGLASGHGRGAGSIKYFDRTTFFDRSKKFNYSESIKYFDRTTFLIDQKKLFDRNI